MASDFAELNRVTDPAQPGARRPEPSCRGLPPVPPRIRVLATEVVNQIAPWCTEPPSTARITRSWGECPEAGEPPLHGLPEQNELSYRALPASLLDHDQPRWSGRVGGSPSQRAKEGQGPGKRHHTSIPGRGEPAEYLRLRGRARRKPDPTDAADSGGGVAGHHR